MERRTNATILVHERCKKINILPYCPSKAEHLEKTLTTAQVGETQSSELPFEKGNHNQTIDGDHSDKKSLKTKIEGESLKEKETSHPQEQDAINYESGHRPSEDDEKFTKEKNVIPLPNEEVKFNINSGQKKDLTVIKKLPSKSMIMMRMPEKKRTGGYITKERHQKPVKLPNQNKAEFTKSHIVGRAVLKNPNADVDVCYFSKVNKAELSKNAEKPGTVKEKEGVTTELKQKQKVMQNNNLTVMRQEEYNKRSKNTWCSCIISTIKKIYTKICELFC